ncbi:Hypp8068 [Branchiostoma lanceolatum]|uniref:Hypp8068 protein n=1 Tax=Branchiostoma lanceolatum TaxID=7740 RepID=A0A8J9Z6C0_BRALA|nr:Hypp8068 [Branchiostoma lanceolatum]
MQCRHLLGLSATLVAVWLSADVTDAAIGRWPLNGGPCPYDDSDRTPCGFGCWCDSEYSYCSTPPPCFDPSCHRCWPELNDFCCEKRWSEPHCDYVGVTEGTSPWDFCPLDMDAPGIVAAGPQQMQLPTGK